MDSNIKISPKGSIDAVKNIGDLISAAIGAAFMVSFLLVFVMLVWGGVQWITSGGDKENTQKAKDRITSALVGLAIIGGAWALMKIVGAFFGVDIFSNFKLPSAAQ
jgi:uncharacterized membrane protein